MKSLINNINKQKTQTQIIKLLYAAILCIALLLVGELVFQIPAVDRFFSEDALSSNMGDATIIWVVLWLLMFAQVTIIPIPAMPLYVFCNNTSLVAFGPNLIDLFSLRTLFFVCFTVSACIAGSIASYFLGRLCGKKAVKWIAGDEGEYNKWSSTLNCRAGKYIYSATILFPIFPDDLLCIVVGALKMNFPFFVLVNIVGKLIGAFCMLLFLRVPIICDFFQSSINGGFPWTLLVYSILLALCIIVLIILKSKQRKTS